MDFHKYEADEGYCTNAEMSKNSPTGTTELGLIAVAASIRISKDMIAIG